jgi:dTDP-4-amino-4,6-dideoxygalactose transaminase
MTSSRKVPFVDLAPENRALRADLDRAMAAVIDASHFIGGPEIAPFERDLAAVCGGAHAIGVSSGTDALLVSLMALGVGPGDEVVTTPFSFFATAGVIARLGARPVFADIEERSFHLDPAAAAAACTARTRAVIPVHLYGRPAALPAVGDGVAILEDAAQSVGAAPVRGRAAALSFFPTKNLGCFGDGGAVVTRDADFAERVRILKNHGSKPKYFHALIGGNFRLDTLQAAILAVKLPHLPAWTAARRRNADRYRALFAATGVPDGVILPEDAPDHIYNQFVIRAPRRDALRKHLAEAGVGTEIYYPRPFHLQECFADLGYRAGAFPRAERACEEVLALPIYPSLDEAQQAYVVEQVVGFYR